MTTANRPTWNPAKGGGDVQSGTRLSATTRAYSAKDIPGFTKLKTRQPGQHSASDIRARDLKHELEEREQKHFSAKEKARKRDYVEDDDSDQEDRKRIKDREDDGTEPISKKNIDADDTDSENESSGSESDNDDDDTAELMRELERIKKEREEEQVRQEREKRIHEKKQREHEIVHGNPLLNPGAAAAQDFTIKKKWFEDTVFKNQSRGEVKVEKRFINDTIRNDFHRKFLQKYIQ
eukprot:TRINITY_DN137_c2_g2_i1.p1 TRINITY_DN137_c2_g2~~TRINITY_DN137_c2_g2_i1.p1  ORF type:complete len:236 (-),score=24.74 TRINITY_DN137_c2_g2_i1:121-828(-)